MVYVSYFIYYTTAVGAGTGALLLFMFKDPVTKGRKAALLVFIMGAIGAPFSLGYLAHCSTLEIVGVTARYYNSGTDFPVYLLHVHLCITCFLF